MHFDLLSLTTKELYTLGRLCADQKPDVARELLSVYSTTPTEQNLTFIASYFNSFCQLQGSVPADYQGPIYNRVKSNRRKWFIAAVLRTFSPHLYAELPATLRLDYGLLQALSTTLKVSKTSVAKVVREIVVQEKVYPEFKAAVDEITSKLISS